MGIVNTVYMYICVFDCVRTAVLARRKLYNGQQASKTANDLGKASYITSILGIVVAVIVVFLVVIIMVSRILAAFDVRHVRRV